MKITLKRGMKRNNKVYHEGCCYEVSDAVATEWIEKGYASKGDKTEADKGAIEASTEEGARPDGTLPKGSEEKKEKPLDKMNRDDLVVKCKSLGIDPPDNDKKKDLVKLIEAKLAENNKED